MRQETFYALDYDRTLLDTNEVVRRFEDFLSTKYPDVATLLDDERRNIEESGGSYDILSAMNRYISEEVDGLIESFVASEQNPELLFPGAKELLAAIDKAGHPWGILTYGGKEWQSAKLRLAGLGDAQALIVDTKGKGERIASWRDRSGQYRLPRELGGRTVAKIVIVDDKASEFAGLPSDGTASGYRVRNASGNQLPSQMGELPANVVSVDGLTEIIAYEHLEE